MTEDEYKDFATIVSTLRNVALNSIPVPVPARKGKKSTEMTEDYIIIDHGNERGRAMIKSLASHLRDNTPLDKYWTDYWREMFNGLTWMESMYD